MFDATLIAERGSMRGDGAPAQNPRHFSGFDIGLDHRGYNELDWTAVTLEANVRLGTLTVTNVLGTRRLDQGASSDIDAQPVPRFHGFNRLEQRQWSDELRFAGRFVDRLNLTAGLYYFAQDYFYLERRVLFGGAIDSTMGADVADSNYAAFAHADLDITAEFRLLAGARYGVEEKTAKIATFVPATAGSRCNFTTGACSYNFPGPGFPGAPGEESWNFFTPKLGFEWDAGPEAMLYGYWTRGVRSGGYNVRNTSFVFAPGPYGPERQNAFELGAKSEWLGGRVRLNGAAFYSQVDDMQRDVNLPDPVVGVVQLTRNTADATIKGFEAEIIGALSNVLQFEGSLGYTDGNYDAVFFDLDGGGIGASDKALEIPRLSEWSYYAGGLYADMLPGGYGVELRAGYAYRSRAAYTDNNTTFLAPVKDLTASATATPPDGRWRFSLYGRNLLDQVTEGVFTPLPATVGGGAFRPLNEGRTIGVSANFTY
jgi:iron complex outermembrane receptor protein